jgi:aspartyl-tRNA(Asn)/glutamyl-tRNA(Gln) amidotransferase subunit C
MSLTPTQIQNIAHLARLELREAEIPVYADSLGRILGLVGELEKAATTGVAPLAHPLTGQVQRLRPDEVTAPNARDVYQRNAPQVEEGLYLVPRVIE